jgi:hypothetical protein
LLAGHAGRARSGARARVRRRASRVGGDGKQRRGPGRRLGTGAGPLGLAPAFAGPIRNTTQFQPADVVARDLNNDRRDDLAVLDVLSQDFAVF